MRRALLLCLLLAACGTPQEQCIAYNTRDLRVVDRLIAETEANLGRGYGLREVTLYRTVWEPCGPRHPRADGKHRPPRMCLDHEPYTVERPVTIDLAAEARKLAQLKEKRKALLKAAGSVIEQCRALYPE